VLAWLKAVDTSSIYLSAVSAGEIQAGIEITRRQNPTRAVELEQWLDQVLQTFNVLAMDTSSFRMWAKLKHGRSRALYDDAMIAGTAITHRLTVVTRNVRDFAIFDVPTLDPFKFKG
jgi:predicted nucleic acid-binding protein